MFWIIPLILLAIFVPLYIKTKSEGFWGDDRWMIGSLLSGLFLLIAAIVCPTNYLESRNEAWRQEQYYEHIILPNVVEETETYVVVDNLEAGIWQAGEHNVFGYNSYVVTTRHWQDVPVIGWHIYRVPEHLKYVRVK